MDGEGYGAAGGEWNHNGYPGIVALVFTGPRLRFVFDYGSTEP